VIIRNPDLLAEFSAAQRCEHCRKPAKCDAAHIYARGLGGGHQLDIRPNVVSLCRRCHTSSHAGNEPTRQQLLAIVAERERFSVDSVEAVIAFFKQLSKGMENASICVKAARTISISARAFWIICETLDEMPDQSRGPSKPLAKRKKRSSPLKEKAKAVRKARYKAAKAIKKAKVKR